VLDVVTGADHFFHGHLSELRSGIEQFFEPLVTATAE
jgi:alpha/beta superfamily hydrolase